MKQFEVPIIYRSPLITAIKKKRKQAEKAKGRFDMSAGRDFAPTLLDLGPLKIFLARHFGFCYGVENAIEIAFRTIEENPGKRIFLLSEVIHNPQVNADLQAHGVKFLQDNYGNSLVGFDELTPEDIVLIPAFGTTVEIENRLNALGILTEKFNTTCPFVEKVWNRSQSIAKDRYTVIIHGKPKHEETRATFSRAAAKAPALIVRDLDQAKELGKYIAGEKPGNSFYQEFNGQYSEGFDAATDLQRIGVVNQTTMLAGDTQAIADLLKKTMMKKYNLTEENVQDRFADTRDTLCYATNDNQGAVIEMLKTRADFAIVVGGYNSSNTSHLVELCEEELPTYFINMDEKILSHTRILHYDFHKKEELESVNYFPQQSPVKVLLTSGASCPDAIVEGVIRRLVEFFPGGRTMEDLIRDFST